MRVLLFTNMTTKLTSQTLESICRWFEEKGIEYDLFSSGIFEGQGPSYEELSASISRYDLLCSLGGDGTTLRAAHIVGISGVPLLSYNFGRLGFLSGAGVEDLFPAMQAAIEGKLNFDPRSILNVEVSYEDGHTDHQIALNEIAVSRGHFGRIVSLDLSINGTFIKTISGDGILVATPTGSTGYSLSAGGPIISPLHEGLCVVPISPHSLTTRAVVTTRDDIVGIVPNGQNHQQLVLFIDGEVFWMKSAGEEAQEEHQLNQEPISIQISVCPEKLLLARYGHYDFYEHISRTFFRGDHA